MNQGQPPAPGWYPDPYGYADSRYWDGVQWTQQVATGGAPGAFRHLAQPVNVVVGQQRSGMGGCLIAFLIVAGVFTLLLTGVVVLAIVGSSSTEPSTAATPRPPATASAEPFAMSITARPGQSGQLAISGVTNLPDGTLITVLTNRPFRLDGEEVRSGHAGGGSAIVESGGFETTVSLDESLTLFIAGDPLQPNIVEISPKLLACAEVRTGLEDGTPVQSPKVAAVIGENGEAFANSPQSKVVGSFTATPSNWLSASTTADLLPANLGAISQAKSTAPTVVDLEGFC